MSTIPQSQNSATDLAASDSSSDTLAGKRSVVKSLLIALACMMAQIVNSTNTSAISVTLPTLAKELDIPEEKLNWIASAGPLVTESLFRACFLIMFGRICDLYGRKKPFLFGSLWMAVFTLAVTFANDDITMDILRGLQGLGRAAMMPAAVGILSETFKSPEGRRKAFTAFSAGQPIGTALGTVVGGAMTQLTKQTWRSPFYLITGLSFAIFVLGLYAVDDDTPSTEMDRRIDWIGLVLVSAGLMLIIFVLSQGEDASQQWKTPYIIVLLLFGIGLLVAFFFWQHYLGKKYDTKAAKWCSPPLMRLSLWTRARGRVAATFIITLLTWCALYSWLYWAQLYYQSYIGLAPLVTVIRLLPAYITGVLYNVILTILMSRIPFVFLMAGGNVLTAIASLLFAVIDPRAVYWAFGFPAAVLAPAGGGFAYACSMIYITKAARPHEQSMVGAVVQTMTQLGTSLGVTVSTVIFDEVSQQQTSGQGAPPGLGSYKAAQWTTLVFAGLGVCAFFLFFFNLLGDMS
ncbi:putative efflux transporter [Guyanagaster necrorhizus]|uniref:Efflux transporter n=1 Tax=Guyanagaster necrorhizus TaxID=856835 RepID=A0A9P7VNT9_9AGAR|nr:putative efflux transporter [Guyanagaster necrorhizus MCA 3950]KAG7444616.1 putative efflux transporter [Guyanagaster necrorhizus MCA 3950]